MSAPQNIVAVIFDFDDTLTDDSTSKLLESYGIDINDFWKNKTDQKIKEGWDPPLAYLSLILELVGPDKALGNLNNETLRKFGATLAFYAGIPKLFDDLQALAAEHSYSKPSVEFYLISGGLEEVIRGSSIANHFTGIYGCRFSEKEGRVCTIQNSISFTEKTKYIYAINKGGFDPRTNPFGVNERRDSPARRIPFENMIYIGDGFTDVPCFSLLDHFGGTPFGVFDPRRAGAAKKAWEQLVAPKRVYSMNAPEYEHDDALGALLRVTVKSKLMQIDVKSRSALYR